jgi:hypothetical protein
MMNAFTSVSGSISKTMSQIIKTLNPYQDLDPHSPTQSPYATSRRDRRRMNQTLYKKSRELSIHND